MTIGRRRTEDILCLFHRQSDCDCLHPVVNRADLIEQLNRQIQLNELFNWCDPDGRQKAQRDLETMRVKVRLADLEG